MRDPFAVRLIERISNLYGVLQHLLDRQRALRQPCGERFPFDVFHYEIVNSVLMANVMESADVRMIQAGDCSRFSLKSLAQFQVTGMVIWEDLDGNDSVKTGIAGAVDLAHPASANTREDFVRAQTFAGDDRHGLLLTSDGGEYNAVRYLQSCVFFGNAIGDSQTPSRFTLGPSHPGGTSAIRRVRPPTIPIRHRNSESHNLAFSTILNMSLMIRPATSNSVDCGQWSVARGDGRDR
jgi:hypothetical protein